MKTQMDVCIYVCNHIYMCSVKVYSYVCNMCMYFKCLCKEVGLMMGFGYIIM